MSDEQLELTPDTGEDERPEGQPDISPEAQASLDRRLAKHGLTPPAEAVEPEPAATPPPRKAAPPETRALPPARGHRQRQAERQSRADIQREVAELKELVTSLLPKDPAIDPEANPEEYTANLIERAVLKALGGEEIVGFLRESHEASVQRRQEMEQIREENKRFDEWGEEMTDWEAQYQDKHPDLFEGYYERLEAFRKASVYSQTQLGVPPAMAQRETVKGLMGLTSKALEMGVHPVAYVDHLFRQTPEFHGKGGNGNGANARREQAAGNREIRERRQASAATSTLSNTKAPPAPTTAGKMAAAVQDAPTGRGRAAALVRAAKGAGGNAKANLKELRGAS